MSDHKCQVTNLECQMHGSSFGHETKHLMQEIYCTMICKSSCIIMAYQYSFTATFSYSTLYQGSFVTTGQP